MQPIRHSPKNIVEQPDGIDRPSGYCLDLPQECFFGEIEQVFSFYGPMPTGVSVTEDGRIFVCFPQWGDCPPYAVAEICQQNLMPYPHQQKNMQGLPDPVHCLISVQSIVADGNGFLWVLDTAAPNFSPPVPGGAKLIRIDLATDKITTIYTFPHDVVLPTTYLNDVRLDFRVGDSGYAYITDSSIHGPGAIIVLDLASGQSFRRLNGHFSTSPQPCFIPKVEGQVLMNRWPDGSISPWRVAADGIALSPGGKTLYYCPLSSRFLYSVPTAALRDLSIEEDTLSSQVQCIVEKGASDGLAADASGNIYAGDYESCSIRQVLRDGSLETVAHDPRILWPDTLSIGPDGYLYFIANQLERQPNFHYGRDLRRKPYSLFRLKINALPAPTR